MKRFSITTFAVIFLGFVVAAAYFYNGNTTTGADKLPAASYGKASLCQADMVWVTLPDAVGRIKTYGKNQWEGINSRINSTLGRKNLPSDKQFSDSRFITFPMDSVKKFICKVEQMVVEYGNKKEDGTPIQASDLGIRFYYAAYVGLTPAQLPSSTYKGRHSLLLVPTYLDPTGTYVEFFPAFVSEDGVPMKLSTVSKLPSPMGRPMTLMLLNEQDVAKNQGTLCPPPLPCSAELLSMADN